MQVKVLGRTRTILAGAQIMEGYPELEPADIEQAIQYAAWLTEEQVVAV